MNTEETATRTRTKGSGATATKGSGEWGGANGREQPHLRLGEAMTRGRALLDALF